METQRCQVTKASDQQNNNTPSIRVASFRQNTHRDGGTPSSSPARRGTKERRPFLLVSSDVPERPTCRVSRALAFVAVLSELTVMP